MGLGPLGLAVAVTALIALFPALLTPFQALLAQPPTVSRTPLFSEGVAGSGFDGIGLLPVRLFQAPPAQLLTEPNTPGFSSGWVV